MCGWQDWQPGLINSQVHPWVGLTALCTFNLVKTDSQIGLRLSLRTRNSMMGQIKDTHTEFCLVDRAVLGHLAYLWFQDWDHRDFFLPTWKALEALEATPQVTVHHRTLQSTWDSSSSEKKRISYSHNCKGIIKPSTVNKNFFQVNKRVGDYDGFLIRELPGAVIKRVLKEY